MERYRITPESSVYYVTFTIVDWLPVFVAEAPCRIVTDSLNYCHREKGLRINAFVIMPTHLHAIVFDAEFQAERLNRTLTDFRKFTGRRLADYCGEHAPRSFQDVLRESAGSDRERRFWQPSRHPEAIYTEPFWRTKLDYLHENPCRKGFVTRAAWWRFSSAAYYVSDAQQPSEVVISPILW